MSKILCLDTATDICSVALLENDQCIAFRDSFNDRSHASQLAVYIDELLKESALKVSDLDAIAVSMGPGSYTGLRIGVSTAKGLCYGAGKPFIAVSTLQSMCFGIDHQLAPDVLSDEFYYCPMLDARRMEVYTAVYNHDHQEIKSVNAEIIDDNSFADLLEKKKMLFFGSGAEKTKVHLRHTNALFYDHFNHSARHMAPLAYARFADKHFEDTAYFEPFYLKDFIATTPKNKVLG